MSVRTDFNGRSIDLKGLRERAWVSDHALVRYFERVLGLDVELVRQRLLSDAVLQAMALQAPMLRTADCQIVFGDSDRFCVVTVLTVPAHVRRPRREKPLKGLLKGKR